MAIRGDSLQVLTIEEGKGAGRGRGRGRCIVSEPEIYRLQGQDIDTVEPRIVVLVGDPQKE
jgi:hypothetical protein